MPVFPDAWMEELLSKNDLAAIVSEYVPLKPKGGRLWGCCPFHNEKTASFSVSRDKQLYYCFGCHAGGSVVQFVMEMEKLSFVEAVKFLAVRAGMELPGEVDDDRLRRERTLRERIYAANKEAARYYYEALLGESGKAALAYLFGRGVDARTVKRFGLGYADGNLCAFLAEKGYAESELIAAGLGRKSERREGCYDFFRERVIFPIIDTGGRVLGFGGRIMGPGEPKYLNTGDTPVYNKRNNLYGLNLLRRKKLADIIMVEGYMDVISLVKGGVENVSAGLGTALTPQQARLLKRYVPTVYLCYDGDSAGQNAALRGLDILDREGLDVRVITIPGGADPDDYVRENGGEAFLALRDQALARNAFRLENLAGRFDLEQADAREAYAKQACAMLGGMQPVERERYAPVVARKAGLALATVQAQCSIAAAPEEQALNRARRGRAREGGRSDADQTELMLLACMLSCAEGAAAVAVGMAEAGLAFSPELAPFADALLAAYAQGGQAEAAVLLASASDELAEAAAAAQARVDTVGDPVQTAAGCVWDLRRETLRRRIEARKRNMPAAGEPGFGAALQELNAMQAELGALKKR